MKRNPYAETYKERSISIESYKLVYNAYKGRFSEVNTILAKRLAGLSISNKDIIFELKIDDTYLKDKIVDFIKNDILHDHTNLQTDKFEKILFNKIDIERYIEDKENIRSQVNKYKGAETHKQILQEVVNDDALLEKIHLRILEHHYDINNIQVQTKLGGKLLKNTSFGERCGIVIAIVLVAGTNPILIDQPEDHLDGKFISDVLVPLLRKQKNNRQIILITRDANIVVGGDAELIHILEGNDQRTEIIPSSIENIDNRKKYIWILDGGTEAFSKREQKYSLELLE